MVHKLLHMAPTQGLAVHVVNKTHVAWPQVITSSHPGRRPRLSPHLGLFACQGKRVPKLGSTLLVCRML